MWAALVAPGCSEDHGANLPEATGFFQVAEVGPRWLLITPDGEPFYSVGVNHVTANNNTDKETGVCPYCEAVDSGYESREAWAEATSERLDSWGFNTIGAWSDEQLFAPIMPYTELLNCGGGQSDYFSDEFEDRVQTIAADKVAPLKDDPNLVGWFLDNELKWGKDWRNTNTMLDEYMELEEGSPGREVAMQYEGDHEGFLLALATQYFRVAAEAIRRVDPPNSYPPIYLTFDTQVERAAAYDEYVQNCFDAPYIVGQHWFEYVDQPVGGRGDGEDNNFGLVAVDDVPYDDFVRAVTATNARAPHVSD
jgi:hypothetical protein